MDDSDYEIYSKYPMRITDKGYAYFYVYRGRVGRVRKRRKLLHTSILKSDNPKYVTDHIDGNRLNCQRSNLRCISPAQNSRNRKPRKHFKGVAKIADNKYQAQITFNYKRIKIGVFETAEDASLAYDYWCRRLDHNHFNTNHSENHPRYLAVINMLDDNGIKKSRRKYSNDKINTISDSEISDIEISYTGVARNGNRYIARLYIDKKRIHLGSFSDPISAARAYDAKVLELGLKRKLNFG